jgi:hypothetical protein
MVTTSFVEAEEIFFSSIGSSSHITLGKTRFGLYIMNLGTEQ